MPINATPSPNASSRNTHDNHRKPAANGAASRPRVWRRRAVAVAALTLLTGCASNNVVTKPVGVTPVDARLMRAASAPRCAVPRRTEYDVAEIEAARACEAAAGATARARLDGLQRAVRVREQTTKRALAAGVQ